jgi:serine protease inhibitor
MEICLMLSTSKRKQYSQSNWSKIMNFIFGQEDTVMYMTYPKALRKTNLVFNDSVIINSWNWHWYATKLSKIYHKAQYVGA